MTPNKAHHGKEHPWPAVSSILDRMNPNVQKRNLLRCNVETLKGNREKVLFYGKATS